MGKIYFTDQVHFEDFCEQYNLEYDFEHLGDYYSNLETNKAFIVYKYAQKEQ